MKKAKASELIFISRIARDGSGVAKISPEEQKQLNESIIDNEYTLISLSLYYQTFIACGDSCYVVKIKPKL